VLALIVFIKIIAVKYKALEQEVRLHCTLWP